MRDYNFFEIYEKKNGIVIDPKSTTFIGLVVLILIVVVSIGLVGRNFYLSNQIKDYTAKIDEIKVSKEYIEAHKLQVSLDAIKEYDKNAEVALKKFDESSILGSKFISKVSSVMPSSTSILQIEIDNARMKANFSIPNRQAGAELILALKGSELFDFVHATNIFLVESGASYIMSIECDLKAGEAK